MQFIVFFLAMNSLLLFAGPREEAQNILSRFEDETLLTMRLDKISKIFLGLPYGKTGPLGEGPSGRYDQDPLYRFDSFDCTTYVETIMALALSKDINAFENHLNNVRYENGEIDYLKRNHFTDLQWIPYNMRNGYMLEINKSIVGTSEIKIAEALINFPGWLKSHKIGQIVIPLASTEERKSLLDELKAFASQFETHVARVPYIEVNFLVAHPEVLNKIPHGTIVNFVRPNWDLTTEFGTRQNISHQGFLFRSGGELYLRHASSSDSEDVQEILFLDYLKRYENHPTLKGIHLMQLATNEI